MPIARISLLILLLALLLSPRPTQAAPSLSWVSSENEARSVSRATGKPLLLYLHADYCEWCKVMEKTTFQDSRVSLLAPEYVLCKVDGEKEGKPLIKTFQVKSYPFQVITDGDREIARAPEFQDNDAYVRFLAVNLPAGGLQRLQAASAGNSAEATTARVTLAVVRAERDDVTGATEALGGLSLASLPVGQRVAIGHALGAALARKQDDAKALPFLKAAATLADAREAVLIHRLLAECETRTENIADALTDWEFVQHAKEATKDEKKEAHKQTDSLKSRSKSSS